MRNETGVQPIPFPRSGVPQDFIHLASGEDPYKLVDLLRLVSQPFVVRRFNHCRNYLVLWWHGELVSFIDVLSPLFLWVNCHYSCCVLLLPNGWCRMSAIVRLAFLIPCISDNFVSPVHGYIVVYWSCVVNPYTYCCNCGSLSAVAALDANNASGMSLTI